MSTDKLRDRLATNARVRYVVRLIAYNDDIETQKERLSITAISKPGSKLGPSKQLYSFVGDYDELKGRTVADAIEMIGVERGYNRVTAIIFPLPKKTNLYPANARGLLQVIRLAEKDLEPKDQFLKPDTFNRSEIRDLSKIKEYTYPIKPNDKFYRGYCHLARSYFCSFDYPSRELIGGLLPDWHPVGFSQINPPDDPCSIPEEKFCAFASYEQVQEDFKDYFGGRAFLIENLVVNNISERIMIDFKDPRNQRIPEIGLPPA